MTTKNIPFTARQRLICGVFLLLLNCQAGPVFAQGSPTEDPVNQTRVTVQSATESVQDAARTAAADVKSFWGRVDESRLRNRTYDEILAWLMMGVMVGALAGVFTSLKPSVAGKTGRLLLGLGGALIGGMAVRVMRIDFGWGPVLIRFEELLFSLVGAVVLIVLVRLIRGAKTKKPDVK